MLADNIRLINKCMTLPEDEIALHLGCHIYEVRQAIAADPTSFLSHILAQPARKEILALFPDETAPVLAVKYHTTTSQIYSTFRGSDPGHKPKPPLDECIEAYNKCDGSVHKAAVLLGCSKQYLRTVLTGYVELRTRVKVSTPIPHYLAAKRVRAIIEACKDTKRTYEDIAAEHGVHVSYVTHLNPEPRQKRHTNDEWRVIMAEVAKPDSNIQALAKKYGVSRMSIYRRLK